MCLKVSKLTWLGQHVQEIDVRANRKPIPIWVPKRCETLCAQITPCASWRRVLLNLLREDVVI